jgi:hypothetical protein
MSEFRDYTIRAEVFQAALGNITPLATLLRSNKPLNKRTREAMAMFLEGQLQPLKNGRGRPPKFRTWEEFVKSPYARAMMGFEFEEEFTLEDAAQEAAEWSYPPGVEKATKQQILDYLRKSDEQRPRAPTPSDFPGSENPIRRDFIDYQLKNRLK